MDYEAYRRAHFVEPRPEPRFPYRGTFATVLYYQDYAEAIAFYEKALGPPAYVEGAGTRGWPIGDGWLTVLHGQNGNPRNLEVVFEMPTVEDAEAMHRALVEAGAVGEAPSDQLMYTPLRYCPVVDPLGVTIVVVAPQPGS